MQDGDHEWEREWRKGVTDRLEHHAKKIDALEQFRDLVVGGASFIAFLLGIGVKTLLRWLGGNS